jgi:hypothetical protein
MSGKYTLEQFEADKQARQEKEAKEEHERRERREKENTRRRYLAEGGTEVEFERAWPEMREEARRRRVMDGERKAREGQRASGVSRL